MDNAIAPELRRDPSTGNWVIIAPQRSERPHRAEQPPDDRLRDSVRASCPFCPGNEAATPPETWRLDDGKGGWRIRVVPNKFALVSDDARKNSPAGDGFVSMPGTGRHEVIIDLPDHFADLATAPRESVRDVLAAYRLRYRSLARSGAAHVAVFRNHGESAGASISHPHSQIIALPIVPPEVEHRLRIADDYVDQYGRPLYADILQREIEDGRRIVLESERFVAFQPFASAAPFETWVMPRRHRASFGEVSDPELGDLASVLRAVLAGVRDALNDPPYNYLIQSAPIGCEDHRSFSWHLRIIPRLTILAGFETATGIQVNTMLPEKTAAKLRDALIAPPERDG